MNWIHAAACRDEDPLIFESTHPADHEEAKTICNRCEVTTECHQLAQTLRTTAPLGPLHSIQGTWAGVLYSAKKKVGRPRKVETK